MRVQVDARLLHGGGIGRYVREVVGRWLGGRDVDRVRCFGDAEELEAWLSECDPYGLAEVVPWADPIYSLRAQAGWPTVSKALGSWKADVTFFPHYDVPLIEHPEPSVVAVHDLIHLRVPGAFAAWKRMGAAAMLRAMSRRASAIVTVSEASRRAICDFLTGRRPPLHVVPNGVSEVFTPSVGPPEGRPSVLVVAPHKPHKNLVLAARVLARLPEPEGWRLVLVGPDPSDLPALARAAGDPALARRMRVTGVVDDRELRDLYRGAHVVLVPSLLEGFALPAFEARACGTRVLALRADWSVDLGNVGVELVPDGDPETWARLIRAPMDEGASASDAPRMPSWDTTAERILGVLASACGSA